MPYWDERIQKWRGRVYDVRQTYLPDHGTKPEQDPQDPPRRFFARLWARLMAPFHTEDVEVSA